MDRMNSKEFISHIGISKWKLEQLERDGVITPMRDGRIRYYNEEQVAQYNAYLAESVEEDEPNNQVVVLVLSTSDHFMSESLIKALQYCNSKNIMVDKNIMYLIEDNTIDVLEPVFNKIKNGKIGRVIYSGDSYITGVIEKVCDENLIQFDNLADYNIEVDEEGNVAVGSINMMSVNKTVKKETIKEKL